MKKRHLKTSNKEYARILEKRNQELEKATWGFECRECSMQMTIQKLETKIKELDMNNTRLLSRVSFNIERIDKMETQLTNFRRIIQDIDHSDPVKAKEILDNLIFTGMLDVN